MTNPHPSPQNQPAQQPQPQPQKPSASISLPKTPEPANDNQPSRYGKAIAAGRFVASRNLYGFTILTVANILVEHGSAFYQRYHESRERTEARQTQSRIAKKYQQPDKEETQRPTVPQRIHLQNREHESAQNVQAKTRTKTETKERVCFDKQDFRPLTTQQRLPADDFLKMLAERGNSEAQESRLKAIYEHVKSANAQTVETLYREAMKHIAQTQGREAMDRAQDAEAALQTDQKVFSELMVQQDNIETVRDAISSASPSTADLSKEEKNAYLAQVENPYWEKLNTLQALKQMDHSRGGASVAEMVLDHKSSESSRELQHADVDLFFSEYIDLINSRSPDKELDTKSEYYRQLGEHIRAHGRDGLSFDPNNCQENEYTVDQKIASQMFIAGHDEEDIKRAISEASPAVAEKDSASKSLYISEEIESVFHDPEIAAWKETFDTWRDHKNVPQSIKRFDCLQKLLIEAPDRPLLAEEIKAICPERPSPNTERDMEPELDW